MGCAVLKSKHNFKAQSNPAAMSRDTQLFLRALPCFNAT